MARPPSRRAGFDCGRYGVGWVQVEFPDLPLDELTTGQSSRENLWALILEATREGERAGQAPDDEQ